MALAMALAKALAKAYSLSTKEFIAISLVLNSVSHV